MFVLGREPVCGPPNAEGLARLKSAWQQGQVTMLLRHAETCEGSPPECLDVLNDAGKAQAVATGESIRKLFGAGVEVGVEAGMKSAAVFHSPRERTRETAFLAFGESEELPALADCKGDFQGFVNSRNNSRKMGRNEILVTHSTCLNSLKNEWGLSLLGFNARDAKYYGVAVLLTGQEKTPLACIAKHDWQALEH